MNIFLWHSEDDFEIIATDCCTKLYRKYPYLRDEKEGILLFVKDYHRIENLVYHDDKIPKLPQNIIVWINETMRNYHVKLRTFAARWCYKVMYDNTITKPMVPHNFIDYSGFKEDLSCKENLFDIDRLYSKIYTNPFISKKRRIAINNILLLANLP